MLTDGVPTFTPGSRREPNSVILFCVLDSVDSREISLSRTFICVVLHLDPPTSTRDSPTLYYKLRVLLHPRVQDGRRRDQDPTLVPHNSWDPLRLRPPPSGSETEPWTQTVPEHVRTSSTPSIIGQGIIKRSESGSTWRNLDGVGVLLQGSSISIHQGKRARVCGVCLTGKVTTGSGPRPGTRR